MTIEFRVDGTLLAPERVRMTGGSTGGVAGLPAAAFNGEVATAGVTIEDPEGDLLLTGWKSFTVDETDCSKPRIFTGWLFSRSVSRGPYRTLDGRIWNCDIVDQNEVFSFKAFRASSAKRPEETDIARVAFAIDSAPMAANPAHNNGLANITDNPITFGEANYVTQYPAELFGSVAGTSGKNFYAYWDDTADEISLYYDRFDATNRTSSLRISNLMSDVAGDPDTYFPMIDAELGRSPENTYSGVLLGYRGGLVYEQDPATVAEFIDRDLVYRTDRIGKLATAEAVVSDMVEDHSDEQDTITCMVRLPSSEVNFIHAGERVEVKFTHLPGYETFSFVRVIRRNVVPTAGRRDRYDVHLELSNRTPERGPGGGDGSETPHEEMGEHWWAGSGSVLGSEAEVAIGGPSPLFEPGIYHYNISIAEDPKPYNAYATDVGFADDFTFAGAEFFIDNTPTPGGDATTYTGSFEVLAGGGLVDLGSSDPIGPDLGTVTFVDAYNFLASTSGPHPPEPDATAEVSFWFDLEGFGVEPVGPFPGQRVNNETPTLTSVGPPAEYTTNWPYADGSLRVFVDNLDQTAAVVETDPAAGAFTLAFTPTSTERVRVYYQAR